MTAMLLQVGVWTEIGGLVWLIILPLVMLVVIRRYGLGGFLVAVLGLMVMAALVIPTAMVRRERHVVVVETVPCEVPAAVPAMPRPPGPAWRSAMGWLASLRNSVPLPGIVVASLVLAVMVYLGYLFLDAGTRGHFTWPLRLFAVVAFAAICAVVALLGGRF